MSTEYPAEYAPENTTTVVVPVYNSFWPLLILLVGLTLWTGFQAYTNYSQGSYLNTAFDKAKSSINNSQKVHEQLLGFAQDLIQTADHDTYAAQIVKEYHLRIAEPDSGTGH